MVVNGHCDVTRGQVQRSNGGLWYQNSAEFAECVRLLAEDHRLGIGLGERGHAYYATNYTWSTIEKKYETMLTQLEADDLADRKPRQGAR